VKGIVIILAAVAVLAGCNVMEPESIAEHACEHVDVEGTAVEAAASMDDALSASIEISMEPYLVTLPPGAGGYVRIVVEEDSTAVLFVGTEGVVQSLSFCDYEVELADPAPNGLCSEEIPEHYHLHLSSGIWHLELGPTAGDAVWLMLVPFAGAHDHEH
jgi:hypothetical protein